MAARVKLPVFMVRVEFFSLLSSGLLRPFFLNAWFQNFWNFFYFRNQFVSIWYTICIKTSSLKCKKWLRKIDQSCWIIQIHTETGVFLYFESMISFSLSNENHAFKKRENLLLRFCTPLMGMIGQFFLANKPPIAISLNIFS